MAPSFCLPHKNRGAFVSAVRLVGTTPMCQDCFEGKPCEVVASRFTTPSIHARDDQQVVGPAKEVKGGWRAKPEGFVSKHEGIDAVAMQNDRSDGMSVPDLCKKYSCPKWVVYQKTKGNGTRPVAKKTVATRNGKSGYGGHEDVLIALRSQRDKISAAISALEGLA